MISGILVRLRRCFSFFTPVSFQSFMFNIFSFVVMISIIGYGYFKFQPSPISSVEVLDIRPSNHVIDRSLGEAITVTRRIFMRRAATLQIKRIWIDESGGVAPSLDDYSVLNAGENNLAKISIVPPTFLAPGKYRYRVTLWSCNIVNSCSHMRLDDIEITIK